MHQVPGGRRRQLRLHDAERVRRIGDADPRLGQAQLALRRSHAVVGAEREHDAAGDRVAVDRSDDRPLESVPRRDHAIDAHDHRRPAPPASSVGTTFRSSPAEKNPSRPTITTASGSDAASSSVDADDLLDQLRVHRVRGRAVDPHDRGALPRLDGDVASAGPRRRGADTRARASRGTGRTPAS